ncbi:SMI1/KNR4 family protein [Salmonella enterica]|nr:SMI1/KNR4 family protein [Salmonella enterica]EJH7441484.1 SMI1/KNR4 family protein [Salmonella enterica]EJH7880764.1 SMI1/KNR4 family protein [Salmonella enterica]EJI6713591.1 SMI1/KNR4 family protein [Salmonella enterica]
MNDINSIIDKMKVQWALPRKAIHRGSICPFLLNCVFYNKIDEVIVSDSLYNIPQLSNFWEVFNSADLFKDSQYGQWGIRILTPNEAIDVTHKQKKERKQDFLSSDLIFGRFLGDSDLLMIDKNSGVISVVLPIDKRNEWYKVADSLGEFFDKLLSSQGDKYWE